jgi:hypothetical protein
MFFDFLHMKSDSQVKRSSLFQKIAGVLSNSSLAEPRAAKDSSIESLPIRAPALSLDQLAKKSPTQPSIDDHLDKKPPTQPSQKTFIDELSSSAQSTASSRLRSRGNTLLGKRASGFDFSKAQTPVRDSNIRISSGSHVVSPVSRQTSGIMSLNAVLSSMGQSKSARTSSAQLVNPVSPFQKNKSEFDDSILIPCFENGPCIFQSDWDDQSNSI